MRNLVLATLLAIPSVPLAAPFYTVGPAPMRYDIAQCVGDCSDLQNDATTTLSVTAGWMHGRASGFGAEGGFVGKNLVLMGDAQLAAGPVRLIASAGWARERLAGVTLSAGGRTGAISSHATGSVAAVAVAYSHVMLRAYYFPSKAFTLRDAEAGLGADVSTSVRAVTLSYTSSF